MGYKEPGSLPALRMIHISGGLRAFDYGDSPICIQAGEEITVAKIERPPYARLYMSLAKAGFRPVGVDFFKHHLEAEGLNPPDWRVFDIEKGFAAYEVEHSWANVRNAPGQDTEEIVDLAGRCRTYLRLLNFRVRELSEAYNLALRSKLLGAAQYGEPVKPGLYAGGYLTYVEAAIHAFLADAAALRDLIAEATWKLVLRRPEKDVATQSTFLKRTRDVDHPIVAEIQEGGADGGWIRNLTELRNAVIHIAPMAEAHELHMLDLRLGEEAIGRPPYLHYALTTKEGGARARPGRFRGRDPNVLAAKLRDYAAFVAESGDALAYASATFQRLAHLAENVRLAAGLSSEMKVFDASNIIGPVVVRRPARR